MASVGPNSPGTLANDSSTGTTAWSTPSNAGASDDVRAICLLSGAPLTGQYLAATNFGFSVPSGATINGIVVEVERRCPGGVTLQSDNRVRIIKSGTIGATDKATATGWPTTDTIASYGGASDLWGETWSDTDINSSTFGVAISPKRSSFKVARSMEIDHIRITVHYTVAGSSQIKTVNTVTQASVNTFQGQSNATVKSKNGITNV